MTEQSMEEVSGGVFRVRLWAQGQEWGMVGSGGALSSDGCVPLTGLTTFSWCL
jgi:hypothetical protein